jgi:hypothetical protein
LRHPIGVVAKECLPPLGGVFYALPIFGDRDLLNVDAELEEFAMDPGSAPRNNPMTCAAVRAAIYLLEAKLIGSI